MREVMKMNNNPINWYPGHFAKTRRGIKEKLNLIDVVYEVIDARMPKSSKIVDIDDLTKEKPRILVMTKYDLCDRKETDKFIAYYQQQGYDVLALDLTQPASVKALILKSEPYLKQMNEKRKAKGMKPRSLRVLIMGVPNVGKSTLINRLVGKKATQVGNRPGVTRNISWIRIHKDMELLDTPGILWPKLENQEEAHNLALLSSIKEEILDAQEMALFALQKLSSLYPEALQKRYGTVLEKDEDIPQVLETIAKKRGALKKGNQIDEEKVYNIILQDVKNNAFGPITLDRIA